MSKRYIAVIIFAVAFVAAVCVARGVKPYHTATGVVWTTSYHITYESGVLLDDSVQAVFEKIDKSASKYNASSRLSLINRNETAELDEILLRLYAASAEVNRITGGVFDPTVSPLADLWGFGLKTGQLSDSAAVDSVMAFVGLAKTRLDGNRLIKEDDRIAFDFNSIAKGLACDEVGRMLARNAVENYIVEIGGEIAAHGKNSRGGAWRVSVDRPVESVDTVIHQSAFVVAVEDGGIATSGNYRNFHEVDGRKVGHIINPLTGYPEPTNLLSVTVIAADCMTADAYATAFMALGVEESKRIAEPSGGLAVSLSYLTDDGVVEIWENTLFSTRYLQAY